MYTLYTIGAETTKLKKNEKMIHWILNKMPITPFLFISTNLSPSTNGIWQTYLQHPLGIKEIFLLAIHAYDGLNLTRSISNNQITIAVGVS